MGSAALKTLRRLAKGEGRRPPKAKKPIREALVETSSPETDEEARWTPIPPEEWNELDRWAMEGTKREEGKR